MIEGTMTTRTGSQIRASFVNPQGIVTTLRLGFPWTIMTPLLLLMTHLPSALGFANNLIVTSMGCMTELDTSEVIMNQRVTSPEDSDFPKMHLAVFVDDNHIESPYHYKPAQGSTTAELTIAFVNPYTLDEFPEKNDLQFIIQLQDSSGSPPGISAEFSSGGTIGCEGNQRVSSKWKDNEGQVQLQIHDVSASFKLWAGWATGQNAVRLTPTLILEPAPFAEDEGEAADVILEDPAKKAAENLIEPEKEIQAEQVVKTIHEDPLPDAKPKKSPEGQEPKVADKLPEDGEANAKGSISKEEEIERELAHMKGEHKHKAPPRNEGAPKVVTPDEKKGEPLKARNKKEFMEAAQKIKEIRKVKGRVEDGEATLKEHVPSEDTADLKPLPKDRMKLADKRRERQKAKFDEEQRRIDLAAQMERNFPDQRSFRVRYEKGVELDTRSHLMASSFFLLSMGAILFIVGKKREKGRRDL